MSMQTILKLRVEASEGNWKQCRELLGELVQKLDDSDAIKLVQVHMRRFLLICSYAFASDAAFEEVVEILRDTDSLRDLKQQITEILNPLDDKLDPDYAGMNSFRSGLNEFKRVPTLSVEGILDVVSGIHSAIVTHYWGMNNMELWRRWYTRESPQDKLILAKYFLPDVETQALFKKYWLYTADIVQELLQQNDTQYPSLEG